MLRLNLSAEPRWYDLGHGVRVLCHPITSAVVAAANASATVRDLSPDTHADVRWQAFIKAVAQICISDWEGVGDQNGGPVLVSDAAVGVLMDLYPISNAFAAAFVTPSLLLVEEKKGSAPLLNGNSAGAQDSADTAQKPARIVRAN